MIYLGICVWAYTVIIRKKLKQVTRCSGLKCWLCDFLGELIVFSGDIGNTRKTSPGEDHGVFSITDHSEF